MTDACSDFTVKLVDTEDNSQKVFHGHEAPILSVALDPKGEFLVRCLDIVHELQPKLVHALFYAILGKSNSNPILQVSCTNR